VKQPVPAQWIAEKKGVKRHLITDGAGLPLAIVVSGANLPDNKGLPAALAKVQAVVPDTVMQPTMYTDAGYIGYTAWYLMINNGYQPCTQTQHDLRWLKKHDPDYVPRRWVVEVCHSWINRFRKVLVRFEKTLRAYYALLCFACAHIVWRKVISR
jgi:putative transposase